MLDGAGKGVIEKLMKRSDVTTRMVLEAYAVKPRILRVDDYLVKKMDFPHKLVWTAMERDERQGYIDYGVNLRGGWLTDLGKAKLADLRAACL